MTMRGIRHLAKRAQLPQQSMGRCGSLRQACIKPARPPSLSVDSLTAARHLRDLLGDHERSDMLYHEHPSEHGTLIADFSRQRITKETLQKLIALADKVGRGQSRGCTPSCNGLRRQIPTKR